MQKLKIRNFLGLKNVDVELDRLTLIIGPQASGKSIIARMIYFCNEYFSGFDDLALLKYEHKKTYDSGRKAEFYKIFPPYTWAQDDFEIVFTNSDFKLTILSQKNSETIDIKTSKTVSDYFRTLKTQLKKFSDEHKENERFSQTRIFREFKHSLRREGRMLFRAPLFVPAARSFYATIREEIFSILSLDEKIDRIIIQFGEFYESEKDHHEFLMSRKSVRGTTPFTLESEYFESVVKGQYVRADNRDWVEMNRGRVELSKASSGQQEAVPLLLAISRFPVRGDTIVIEEPEAHLFPDSQIKILEYMIIQAVQYGTGFFFTTHSPYLLTSLNNHLIRFEYKKEKSINPDFVRAYCVDKGISRSIVDSETRLISADFIDEVSERLAEEFAATLEESDESK